MEDVQTSSVVLPNPTCRGAIRSAGTVPRACLVHHSLKLPRGLWSHSAATWQWSQGSTLPLSGCTKPSALAAVSFRALRFTSTRRSFCSSETCVLVPTTGCFNVHYHCVDLYMCTLLFVFIYSSSYAYTVCIHKYIHTYACMFFVLAWSSRSDTTKWHDLLHSESPTSSNF